MVTENRTAILKALFAAGTEAGVQKAAEMVRDGIAALAPRNTGRLEASYHVVAGDDQFTRYVTNTKATFYAVFLEHGTRHMAARPHVVPGMEATRDPATERIKSTIRSAAVEL